MSDPLAGRRNLESLRKEAKRWVAALRADAADARARFERATGTSPFAPTLRDVQHALARENGFAGWAALKAAVAGFAMADTGLLAQYETMVDVLLDAYRTGTPKAMERLYRHTWHRRSWDAFRAYAQLDLGRAAASPGDDIDITREDARYLIAKGHGFDDWHGLEAFAANAHGGPQLAWKPVRVVVPDTDGDEQHISVSRDWDAIMQLLRAPSPGTRLDAAGQMTDGVLSDIANIPTVTALDLSNSQELTDEGIMRLAAMPRLEHLDLSGTAISDRGLQVLRHLPALKSIHLRMTGISDAGAATLAYCEQLEEVDLARTGTGDAALRALAGKPRLRTLHTGNGVTDAGIPLLHELPVFKRWHGGEVKIALLSYDAEPNRLVLRGSFTDQGMQQIRGLDGLFALNIDARELALTAAAMEPLVSLPNLGWLAADARDDWMPHIARMSALRFLGAQDTLATDDGFVALARSATLEYVWGRRCHNLQRRGFQALAQMPALRGLSVSCLNVDDAGLAALPSFPSLRELMPMDIPDAGYRHVGACTALESLILMYCRDTTDAATELITGLSALQYYFNSYTAITDRTPEVLATMNSLERITFDTCHGLTNAGVARLANLPRLRELRVAARHVTADVVTTFPARIKVYVGG